MKKRLISIFLLLGMLLSLLPTAAFAATGDYGLAINEFEFTSSNLTYRGSKGTAGYDPKTKTLTLSNFETAMGGYNTVIYSEVDGLNIVIDGQVTIRLADTGDYNEGAAGFALNKSTVIRGLHNDKTKDKIVITSTCTTHAGSGTTHTGIATAGNAALTMSNVSLSMTDTSTQDRSGHATLIDAYGNVEITNCALEAQGCQLGLYMGPNAGATVKNTAFSMKLSGSGTSGVNLATGTQNLLANCTGTIEADYPLYSYGAATVTGSGKLTLKTGKMGVVATKYPGSSTAGSVTFRNANVEIQSSDTGIQVEDGGSVTQDGGTVAVTARQYGVSLKSGAKLELQSGSLGLTGTGASGSAGISMGGPVSIKDGKLTISRVTAGIQNVGTYTASFSGGTHTMTASSVGYIDNAAGALTVEGSADVTVTAPIAVQLTDGNKLNLTGGKLTLNGTTRGLNAPSDAGKTTLSGGTLNVNCTGTGNDVVGIYAGGQVEFGGTNVNFTGCKTDLVVANAGTKITSGKLSLSGSQIGMNVGADFTMEGGEIVSTGCLRGVVANGAAITLKGGKASITATYPFWATNGGSFDFAGAEVLGNSTENCAMYVDPQTSGNSYKVTGGTVELQSAKQAAASELYAAIPADYGVWAGENKDSAKRISSPNRGTLLGNKYVRIAKLEAYTLTLVGVKEGTSATHNGGDSFTYTAKEAPAGQHFSHWELTVDGTTTSVGMDTTVTGTMPSGNAKLEAVYEACSGGTATCKERAVCDVCHRPYGDLAAHSYTAETVEEKYLKSEATCTEAAVYYKSCTGCGESSKGTEGEATFTSGTSLGHSFGAWTSNGDGTHTRICARDNSHKETEDCHGGHGDCQHKAVCEDCGQPYGDLGRHSYTAKTVEEKYLKSEATCTEAAVYYKSCTGCGESSKGTEGEATFTSGTSLGHSFGAWTSNGDGTHTRICARDNSHKETEDCHGGHGDCQHKAVCEDCGQPYGDLGRHSYTAETVDAKYLKSEATCTEAAVYYKSCIVCGESSQGAEEEDAFTNGDPLGHDEVTDPAKAATCTETGLTEGKHCDRCHQVLTAQNEIPALGHDVPTGTVRREATCAEEGEMVGTCQRCGKENVVGAIAKLPHQEITLPAVAATCSSSGWTEGKKCTVCGQVTEGREVIMPLGHTVVTGPETEEWTAGSHCSVCGTVLQAQMRKGGGLWVDNGNYDAELYASEPGNWEISDAADLAALSKKVSDGATFEGYTITLTADIDLSAHVWVPIGQTVDHNPGLDRRPFKGTFLGNMHRITGMRIVSMTCYDRWNEAKYIGLFGKIANATVSDLIVEGDIYNTTLVGTTNVGGIVGGMESSTLRNCGFVGSIYQCFANAYSSYGQYAGGVVGDVSGQSTVANCFAIGDITVEQADGTPCAGGIAASLTYWGEGTSTIENCYSAVQLTARGRDGQGRVDGIVVQKYGNTEIRSCTTQVGFNTAVSSTSGYGTNLTKEAMTAAAGTELNSRESPLVDALNAGVQESWSKMQLRAWIQDSTQNGGYPTFGISAAALLSNGTWSVQALAPGETAKASAFAIPAGYLVEWYADEEYTTPFDFTQPIYDNTVIYGKLISNTFSIVYVLNGGENAVSNPTEYLGGVGVAAFAAPTRENYLFEGWFADESFTTAITEIPASASGSYTLFAKWSLDPNHTHRLGACVVGADGRHEQVCSLCGDVFDCTYTDVVTDPTCYSAGYTTHTCDVCGNSYVDTIVEGGHKWTTEVHAPTHTEMGYTVHTCRICGCGYVDSYVPAEGHKWDGGKVTAAPTVAQTGRLVHTCTVCGATKEELIPMLSSCDGGSGCPSGAYTDVPGVNHWAHVGIDFVLKSGLFYGTSDTTFDPNGEMTRAMLVTVLYRLEGQPKPAAANPFTDVPTESWYTDAVAWAAENGIVSGVGEGKFNPNGKVTREQMAAILYRYTKFKGLAAEGGSFTENYPDEGKISAYARTAMIWANANGLISGTKRDGVAYLDPNGNATRAQVASILMRFVKNVLSK